MNKELCNKIKKKKSYFPFKSISIGECHYPNPVGDKEKVILQIKSLMILEMELYCKPSKLPLF